MARLRPETPAELINNSILVSTFSPDNISAAEGSIPPELLAASVARNLAHGILQRATGRGPLAYWSFHVDTLSTKDWKIRDYDTAIVPNMRIVSDQTSEPAADGAVDHRVLAFRHYDLRVQGVDLEKILWAGEKELVPAVDMGLFFLSQELAPDSTPGVQIQKLRQNPDKIATIAAAALNTAGSVEARRPLGDIWQTALLAGQLASGATRAACDLLELPAPAFELRPAAFTAVPSEDQPFIVDPADIDFLTEPEALEPFLAVLHGPKTN